jgi:hypothetical protein
VHIIISSGGSRNFERGVWTPQKGDGGTQSTPKTAKENLSILLVSNRLINISLQRMRAYKVGHIPRSETEFSISKEIGSIVKNE